MSDDIVLVTVDSLGADYCGWQSHTPLTPFLNELAVDSLTFTEAVSPGPRTFSSVPVTHTGTPLPYSQRPVTGRDDRIRRMKTHLDATTPVSETLRKEGYTTVAFTANPWTSADVGFDAGFDEFVEVGREGGEIHDRFKETFFARPAWLFDCWLHKDHWFSQWRTFYDDIVSTIDDIDGPVFAWVFLIDPHNPYLVPRTNRVDSSTYGMYAGLLRGNQLTASSGEQTSLQTSASSKTLTRLQDAYRDCVRSVDRFAERLVSDIDDGTLLVFHSDHGEAFGEHGTFGHQSVLYEENIHVPFLIHGVESDDSVVNPVSTITIPKMLQSYARNGSIDPSEFTTEYVMARTLDDFKVTLRGSRWKYIRTRDGEALYDLEGPGETVDMGSEYPSVQSDLREECNERLDSLHETTAERTEVTQSETMKQHLESLGYLQE
jgi:arylsulfatase